MRLVTYNILDGGEGRADPLAEVIEAQKPDVVALVEADDASVVERIANRLKMDFVIARGNGGTAALLSRWPISESVNQALINPGISKSFLEAIVIDPQTRAEWPIGVLHLHARAALADEQKRLVELGVVLQVFSDRRASKTAHLLCGDFNAHSPIQKIDPDKLKTASRQAWIDNGNMIPRTVIQQILDAGYLDCLAACDANAAMNMGTFTTQHPGQRVDYIFAFGLARSQIKSAWIEQDRLAKYASDHFPMCVEIG